MRWCPGCGDYAILAAIQRTLPDLERAAREDCVYLWLGCAAAFRTT